MAASQSKTYTWLATRNGPNWWPNRLPEAVLDFSLDISGAIDPAVDIIGTVSASSAPSGAGEMALSGLTVSEDILTVTCSGGVPTRVYKVRFTVAMLDGCLFEFLVHQGIPAELSGYPVPPPPSPGFGPAITWPGLLGFYGCPVFGRLYPFNPSPPVVSPVLLGGF